MCFPPNSPVGFYLQHPTKTAFVQVTKNLLVVKPSGHSSVLTLLYTTDHSLFEILHFSWFPEMLKFPGFFSDLRGCIFSAPFFCFPSKHWCVPGLHPGLAGLLHLSILQEWPHPLPWLEILPTG